MCDLWQVPAEQSYVSLLASVNSGTHSQPSDTPQENVCASRIRVHEIDFLMTVTQCPEVLGQNAQ